MIMRAIFANAVHTATPADLPRLRELFGHANDAPYDLARVTAEKCFEDGVGGAPVTTIFGDFLGVSVTCGKYLRILAVHRQHRRLGIGTELLRDAVARGARVVGAEAGNYFTPRVPLAPRARGYGRQLLLGPLADMRTTGYVHAIIAWPDALDFYAKACGATVHERFATFLIDSAP